MITEDYVSFETAKLLKEKGFDWECVCYYFFKDEEQFEESLTHWNWNGGYTFRYSAPTLQMAMKWLRNKHDIFIEISVDEMLKDDGYQWALYNNSTKEIMPYADWEKSYEEACEAAIKYCLENLI